MTRGPSPSVARFLSVHGEGSTMGQYRHTAQIAPCGECGAHLEFTTGPYGQTLEICPTRACRNHIPHAPIRAADAPLIVSKVRAPRNKNVPKRPELVREPKQFRTTNGKFGGKLVRITTEENE